jgi:type II secretory pathway component PulF
MLAIARARDLPLRPALAAAEDLDGAPQVRRFVASIPEDGEDLVLEQLRAALAAGIDKPAAGMLAALQEVGTPADGLHQVAAWLSSRADQRHHFYRAVGYPFSVMITAALIYTVLFQAFILPILAELFSSTLSALSYPPSSLNHLFLTLYTIPTTVWHDPLTGALYVISVASFCAGIIYLGVRLHSFRIALMIPYMRQYLRIDTARSFAQTMALLLHYGIPAPAAVRLAAGAVSNRWLQGRLHQVAAQVEEGEGLGESLRESQALPTGISWRLWSAYYRSALVPELQKVAESCEQDLGIWELKIESSTRVIAIVIAAVTLVPVLLAAVSMYLPLYTMTLAIG